MKLFYIVIQETSYQIDLMDRHLSEYNVPDLLGSVFYQFYPILKRGLDHKP